MDKIEVSSGNGIELQGFINIELINKKDKIKRTYKNTITTAGKQFLLSKSAGRMLSIAADTFGMMMASNVINKESFDNTGYAYTNSNANRSLTNVLLNLGSEADSLTANSTFINVWDNNLAEASKLVGYANNNIVATQDGKEGTIDYCKGEYVIDANTVCERWKYPEGVATGTIDTIAMMPASMVKFNRGDGINIGKCIDRVNTQYTNFGSLSTGFMIPGVNGYTANDEILLNFNQDGISKWKFNLTTGEVTQVKDTDKFFVLPMDFNYASNPYYYIMDALVIGNYLYTLSLQQIGTGSQPRVIVHDLNNNMNIVTKFTCGLKSNNDIYHNAKFLKIGNDLYVTAWATGTVTESNTPGKLWKLNNNGTYFNSAGAYSVDFSSIGFNAPSGINLNYIGLGNYGNSYVMFVGSNYTQYMSSTNMDSKKHGYKSVGYVFTDLSNPLGTVTDVICGINPGSILFSAGSNKGMLRIGFDSLAIDPIYFGSCYDYTECNKKVANNSDNGDNQNKYITLYNKGVIYTPDKSWTDVISFVKLNSPIVKGDADIMYVSYGYKVV